MIMSKKFKLYIAAGWFSPAQKSNLDKVENVVDKLDWIDVISPRRIFVCPPDAPKEVQDETFSGNLHHIKTSDFLIVCSLEKDPGTIWESGYAYANNVPIVYFHEGLPKGAKFNLMLAKSGIKVCTSFEQLEDYLGRCYQAGELLHEPYDKEIE